MNEAKPEPAERKSRSGPSSGSFKVARVEVQELAAVAGPEVFGAPATDLLSDELLVDRTLHGDRAQYEVLMRRNVARLYRIARGIIGNALRAEDSVQAAFVHAYENLSSYDRKLRFGDWLSRIAIFGALASLRKVSQAPATERRLQLELVRQLEDAVDGLPERFRVPFTLCVLDDMPPQEAAAVLDMPDQTLQVAAFRGRLRVRRKLGTRFDEAESRAFGLDWASAEAIFRKVWRRLGLTSPEPQR